MAVRIKLAGIREWPNILNRREQVAAGFIIAALVVGAGLAYLQRWRLVRLSSACQIVVARADKPAVAVPTAAPLNLNTATVAQLEALPGIGPTLARRILILRDQLGGFTAIAQLQQVSGIGPKRYAALRDLVTVTPQPAPAESSNGEP